MDIFELEPTKFLTQNEIDAAKSVQVAEFNVQNQQKIEWSRKLIIAKAYVDQLERSKAMSSGKITNLRKSIQSAESSKLSKKDRKKLKSLAKSLKKTAGSTKSGEDSVRMKALAEILKRTRTLIWLGSSYLLKVKQHRVSIKLVKAVLFSCVY